MITDYTSLRQAIADWLARSDLTNQIPTFIQLAEARMNKDLRVLDMQTEFSGTVTASTKSMVLPGDVLELQSVRLDVAGRPVEVKPLAPIWMSQKDDVTGSPLGYVRVGDLLYLIGGNIPIVGPGNPAQDVTYSLLYLQSLPSLTDVGTTIEQPGGTIITVAPITANWLLQREPGMYLYASLIEASPYLQDDARTLVWAKQYESILTGMRVADDNARYGNSPTMQIRGMTP